MKLNIENFAKIKRANIIVDGITVIAGENNTGKSTVGKILFSLFNVLSSIEQKVFAERLNVIESTSRSILQSHLNGGDLSPSAIASTLWRSSKQMKTILKRETDEGYSLSDDSVMAAINRIVIRIKRTLPETELYNWEEITEELFKNTKDILQLPEGKIVLETISRYFKKVFNSQMNFLGNNDSEAKLALNIKGKDVELIFNNNFCTYFKDSIHILHKAIYIDNPFIIDELSSLNDLNPMNALLKELMTSKTQEGVLDGIIETVLAKEKLSDIYDTLQTIVPGEIIIGSDDEFYLKDNRYSEPIAFNNLSAGIKSFLILRMLIEEGAINKKDVVILDEPEVHLHPQWQIKYAELIVLLQKHFDLSVVVTTHSPYFVDAIDLFSHKYDTNKKVNYYISNIDDKAVELICVNDKMEYIYKKMASPLQLLDTLRYELNNSER